MARLPIAALLVLVLTAPACDTVGEVPTFDDLRARYGGLPEGTFLLYDADLDSTFTGSAVYSPTDPGVTLQTTDFSETDPPFGMFAFVGGDGFSTADVGDRFDVRVGYDREGSFSSVEGKAEVTARDERTVSGVFYARVRPSTVPFGNTAVIEGGFSASRPRTAGGR